MGRSRSIWWQRLLALLPTGTPGQPPELGVAGPLIQRTPCAIALGLLIATAVPAVTVAPEGFHA